MRRLFSLAALLVCGTAICSSAGAQVDETFSVPTVTEDDPAKAAAEEVKPGDNKVFTIKTDTDIGSLKVDDIYSNGQKTKTLFKIKNVVSDGSKGGSVEIIRISGKADPEDVLVRESSVDPAKPGPINIAIRKTLLDIYASGGPFMHPIAALAFLSILMAINSLWIYRFRRQAPPAFVTAARESLLDDDIEKFEELALKERGLFPYVCRAMADRFDTSTIPQIEARAQIAAERQITRLRLPVKVLNLAAAAAPLLGLLGTIVGMYIVFEAVRNAGSADRLQELAGGIRVKLLSTAGALCVAIPSLFLYFIFNHRLANIIAECEMLSEQFLHQISIIKSRPAQKAAPEDGDPGGDADEDEKADKPPKSKRGGKEARV